MFIKGVEKVLQRFCINDYPAKIGGGLYQAGFM
jgi:hypothetical protein